LNDKFEKIRAKVVCFLLISKLIDSYYFSRKNLSLYIKGDKKHNPLTFWVLSPFDNPAQILQLIKKHNKTICLRLKRIPQYTLPVNAVIQKNTTIIFVLNQ